MANHEITVKDYNPTPAKSDRTTHLRKLMETELNLLMEQNNGLLTAEAVIAQAENPGSALHTFFTWDDDEAAHKWRLVEARQLITSIRMTQVGVGEDKMRSLVSLSSDRKHGGGYRRLEDVMASPDLRHHLLETALAELNAIQRKYRALEELQIVWGAVDVIEGEVAG